MIVYADTHVHLYRYYDLTRAFESAWKNFARASSGSPEALHILYLTEREDCSVFDVLAGTPESIIPADRFIFTKLNTPEVLHVKRVGGGEMFLVAGRQIKTAERLEILVLHTRDQFSDGFPLESTLESLLESQQLVVLNWSLGKWMFSRGKIIERAIENFSSNKILIGDIAARPCGWGEPRLFRLAREKSFVFVAGSDPLPFGGEEDGIASYLTRIETELSPADAFQARWFFRDVLYGAPERRSFSGQRNSWLNVGKRLMRNYASRGRAQPA